MEVAERPWEAGTSGEASPEPGKCIRWGCRTWLRARDGGGGEVPA